MEKSEILSFPMVIRSGGRGQSLHNEMVEVVITRDFEVCIKKIEPPRFCLTLESPT